MERGVVAWLRRTPGRLGQLLAGVALLAVVAGITGATTAADRAALVDHVITRDAPVALAAQDLYRSLSDADATVAAAFLTAGPSRSQLRDRYRRISPLLAPRSPPWPGLADRRCGRHRRHRVEHGHPGLRRARGDRPRLSPARATVGRGLPRQSSGMMRETCSRRPSGCSTRSPKTWPSPDSRRPVPGYALPLGGCTVVALVAPSSISPGGPVDSSIPACSWRPAPPPPRSSG